LMPPTFHPSRGAFIQTKCAVRRFRVFAVPTATGGHPRSFPPDDRTLNPEFIRARNLKLPQWHPPSNENPARFPLRFPLHGSDCTRRDLPEPNGTKRNSNRRPRRATSWLGALPLRRCASRRRPRPAPVFRARLPARRHTHPPTFYFRSRPTARDTSREDVRRRRRKPRLPRGREASPGQARIRFYPDASRRERRRQRRRRARRRREARRRRDARVRRHRPPRGACRAPAIPRARLRPAHPTHRFEPHLRPARRRIFHRTRLPSGPHLTFAHVPRTRHRSPRPSPRSRSPPRSKSPPRWPSSRSSAPSAAPPRAATPSPSGSPPL